jgi:hypothetical protein
MNHATSTSSQSLSSGSLSPEKEKKTSGYPYTQIPNDRDIIRILKVARADARTDPIQL